MSRTTRGSKPPGYFYGSSRLHGRIYDPDSIPGRRTKTLTHRKERRETRAIERAENDDLKLYWPDQDYDDRTPDYLKDLP